MEETLFAGIVCAFVFFALIGLRELIKELASATSAKAG
tara:strand:- start:458 stop:571 length:114 start_codon:yes stop_codon:yes gene_type:complete